jgi:hypothetical protein
MTVSYSNLLGGNPIIGTIPVASGGTGATTLALNSVLLGNGSGTIQSVAPGAQGSVLVSNGSTWVSGTATGGTGKSIAMTMVFGG